MPSNGGPEEKGRGKARRRTDGTGRRLSQWAGGDQPRGGLAPGALMPEEPRNWKSHRTGHSRRGPQGGFREWGPEEEGDGGWILEQSQRRQRGACLPQALGGQGERVGLSGLDSLLSDDVIPRQGRAGHPRHLHVVGDLREVQAQVHAMDGHSSAPFRRSRHRQDLREGSGRRKPSWSRKDGQGHPFPSSQGGFGTPGVWGETVFPPLSNLPRIPTSSSRQ